MVVLPPACVPCGLIMSAVPLSAVSRRGCSKSGENVSSSVSEPSPSFTQPVYLRGCSECSKSSERA